MMRLILLVCLFLCSRQAGGDVVVLANRTGREVPYRVIDGVSAGRLARLPAWDTVPIPVNGPSEMEIHSPRERKRYHLDANAAYYIGRLSDGRLELQQIGLGSTSETRGGRTLAGTPRDVARVTVEVLVDEEEPARDGLWQDRLRKRIAAASEILEKHCRVRLDVVSFATWNSDNATNEFPDSMAEFEREVDPRPARLAIGFSSQYQVPETRRTHLGGTRGPLHSHILLREWSQHVDERERLELLVHELGHYFGAAHSPEPGSVMRPVLGDGQARMVGFEIRFDPVNTLAMYLVGEEIRYRGLTTFADLTSDTRRRLHEIYTELGRANPRDESAKRFVQLVQWHRQQSQPEQRPTQSILRHIVSAAEAKDELAADARPTDDALTQYYVQRAARAAALLDDQSGPAAFLLAIGIAIDDSEALRTFPQTAEFVRSIESDADRKRRLSLLGNPTLHGRADLAKHFFVSAYLTAALGPETAATLGEGKELLDALGGSGFSFADTAANRAGIVFARRVLDGSLRLDVLAREVDPPDYMPPVTGLEEGLPFAEFQQKYGGKADKRYLARVREIDRRIAELPLHRELSP